MNKILIVSLLGMFVVGQGTAENILVREPQAVVQDTTKKDTNRGRQTDRMRRGQIDDRRPTGDPKQLRYDSLRRGGATKVDTIRR